jgi:hypothetical protein
MQSVPRVFNLESTLEAGSTICNAARPGANGSQGGAAPPSFRYGPACCAGSVWNG